MRQNTETKYFTKGQAMAALFPNSFMARKPEVRDASLKPERETKTNKTR